MSIDKILLNGVWQLNCLDSGMITDDGLFEINVPGDVHQSLLEASLIPDPFWADNYKRCDWVSRCQWNISRKFEVPASMKGKSLNLVFDGIDTYSTVKLNGKIIGETGNMFRQYCFDISDRAKFGEENLLEVILHSTRNTIEKRDVSGYFGCFNVHRIFSRRAQCQFSWDWAPNLISLGIWQDVRLEAIEGCYIEDVYARGNSNGQASFNIGLDSSIVELLKSGNNGYELDVEISNARHSFKQTQKVGGCKNFIDVRVADPDLWYPNGYGEPNLYDYKVVLRDGKNVIDSYAGRLGFRTFECIQKPDDKGQRSFYFKVNGKPIFSLGANWVPADCFTGTIKEEKYRRLISLAKEANLNTIRVWGGGIYEKDIFYDLCDENGILVWQDMMFACGDIPDDDMDFVAEVIEEFKYQVKRLRNHTSILHWCGGNEKTGAFGALIKRGDLITRYIARGIINDLVPEASYTPSSPFSYNDIANDSRSGDTHGGTYEEAFTDDIRRFRQHIEDKKAVFMSEFGLHGPPVLKSVKKFIPKADIWPLGDIWEAHVQDNPYNSIPETFVKLQEACAARLFYQPQSVEDFIKTAGTFYAEYLYAEFVHHRRRLPENGGAMIWMLNDCWPAANWSVIDYYGEPKQAYYALKRACRAVMTSVKETVDSYQIFITNNSLKPISGEVSLYIDTVDGAKSKLLARADAKIDVNDSVVCLSVAKDGKDMHIADSYLRATFAGDSIEDVEIYFHNLWKDITWLNPKIEASIIDAGFEEGKYKVVYRLFADKFARCVNISLNEDIDCYISDNYFDMQAGSYKDIVITANQEFDNKISIGHWLTEWGDDIQEENLEEDNAEKKDSDLLVVRGCLD